MALTWPENPRLIGTKITRLDGLAKASGLRQVSQRHPSRGNLVRGDAV